MVILRRMMAKLALKLSKLAGNPLAMGLSLFIIVTWAVSGPFFLFSETWQLIINTLTTIITFILAISIQYTQNKDSKAIHLKLNKLLSQSEDVQEALEQIEKELEDD